MFFIVSKVLWFIVNPGNLLLIVLGLGVWLLWTRWRRAGRWLVSLAVLAGL
ncbi:MAG: YdcF family protein, partial [Proteobacteria bacterium]|nr:YdcF family protein [Pseudomonadota bacterium]